MFFESLLWLLPLYMAHVVFMELLYLIDCRDEAPLQWKWIGYGVEHVVLSEDGYLFSPALNTRNFRRPVIILLQSFFLVAIYFMTHFLLTS